MNENSPDFRENTAIDKRKIVFFAREMRRKNNET